MAEPAVPFPGSLDEIRAAVDLFAEEARGFLPGLTADLQLELDVRPVSRLLVPDYGVGGLALSQRRVVLALDPTFAGGHAEQILRLRGAVFHECFHLAHGFTVEQIENRPHDALGDAVCEGAATVFERERSGSSPPWGEYYGDETMVAWAAELAALPTGYDRRRWKFWDAAERRAWVVYRVGTFAVDRALRRHPRLAVEDLAAKSPREIQALADLQALVR